MREAHYLQHEPFNMKMPTEVKMLMRNMSEQVCPMCVCTYIHTYVCVYVPYCAKFWMGEILADLLAFTKILASKVPAHSSEVCTLGGDFLSI